MNFRDNAFQHLARYKKRLFPLVEDGTYLHRGRKYRKGHILPRFEERSNVIEAYRDRFFASEHGTTKLHKYFHHLNSSQALCINLFYPLVVEERLNLLHEFIPLPVNGPLRPRFESESTLEVAQRRTSFDFHVQANAHDLYIEVKYTEDGFGAARDDDEHRAKFKETYVPLLKRTKYLVPACSERTFFFRNYQLLRNLLHITERSDVIFLYPRANTTVASQAAHARDALLTAAGRRKLHLVYLDDFVEHIESRTINTPLGNYFASFRDKYLGFAP